MLERGLQLPASGGRGGVAVPARARPATGSLDTPQHLRHGDTVLLPSACLQPALQVYSLPPAISPNTWLLNTHYDQLERRYGGWQFGAGRGREQLGTADSITIVHYNNKVLYNARLRAK